MHNRIQIQTTLTRIIARQALAVMSVDKVQLPAPLWNMVLHIVYCGTWLMYTVYTGCTLVQCTYCEAKLYICASSENTHRRWYILYAGGNLEVWGYRCTTHWGVWRGVVAVLRVESDIVMYKMHPGNINAESTTQSVHWMHSLHWES